MRPQIHAALVQQHCDQFRRSAGMMAPSLNGLEWMLLRPGVAAIGSATDAYCKFADMLRLAVLINLQEKGQMYVLQPPKSSTGAYIGAGDLKRPACARCIESGWPCVYSSVKRKPGPTKGTRRVRKIANRALTSSRCSVPRPRTPSFGLPDSPVNFLQFDLSADQDLSGQNDSLERGISSAHDSYPGGLALEASDTLHKHRGLAHHRLSCDKEKDL